MSTPNPDPETPFTGIKLTETQLDNLVKMAVDIAAQPENPDQFSIRMAEAVNRDVSATIGAQSIEMGATTQNLQQAGKDKLEIARLRAEVARLSAPKLQRPGFFARLVGCWRLWWGLCPCCNSDAPEMDRCDVCNAFRLSTFPPSTDRKAVWWRRFLEGKGLQSVEMDIGAAVCGMSETDVGPFDPSAVVWPSGVSSPKISGSPVVADNYRTATESAQFLHGKLGANK